MTSFTLKSLRFTFVLSNNAVFEGTGSNTLQVAGLRSSVNMKGSGFPAFPECEMRIFGLRQTDMNALTALAFQLEAVRRNTVTVEADSGDGRGWSTIFAGQIIEAGPDYSGMPAVPMRIGAQVMGFELVNPATPTAFTGATSIFRIVSAIAAKMGYIVEDGGVDVTLDSPYFAGTLGDQLRAVSEQANVDAYPAPETNVIVLKRKDRPRDLPTWVLSPSSGLVGYPTLDSRGFIQARSIFNPALRVLGRVRIEGSDVPRANGDFIIGPLQHTLEAVNPDGAWFTDFLCYPEGSPTVLP